MRMLGKRIGVEKLGKPSNKDSFFALPEDSDATGYIRYVGDGINSTNLKVGIKVYYGKERHCIKIGGIDIWVMDEGNVYAIAEDESAEKQKYKTESATS